MRTWRASGWRCLVVALAATAIAGCGGNGDDGGGDTAASGGGGGGDKLDSVAVSIYARDNPFLNSIVQGAQAAAKELGIDLKVTYGENDPAQQVDQIQNLVTTQPGALIVAPIDRDAIAPAVKDAADAGVKVVTVADDLADDAAESRLFYAGNDYRQTGTDKAKYIVEELGGKGKVAVIHLIRGLSFTEEQWDGAKEVFSGEPGIEIVGEDYAGGAASNLGLEAAENFLTAHSDIDALYVDNDDLALGAIRAAKQRKVAMDDIVVVGANGTPTAIEAVTKGDLDMTVSFCGFAQGVNAVRGVYDHVVKGADVPEPLESINVTRQNIKEVESKLGPGCSEAG